MHTIRASLLTALLMVVTTSTACTGFSAVQTASEPAPLRAKVGMNLSGVFDWSREWPFVDVFKHSRPWFKHGAGEFVWDENGYPLLKPGQSVDTLLCREISGNYPKGKYVATYEGTGKVEIKRFDVKKVVQETKGRIEFDVEPAHGGIQVVIGASDPKDPIRNIKVWMPGFENAKSPFHPLYLKRLEPFGAIRFMDWQRTNNSPIKTWKERAKPADARWANDAGVPIEPMVELANTCKANPWFCMPHQADDEYVREFAKVVKEKLDPALKVYVEYSNEVWNGQFRQARHAHDEGKKLGLSDNGFQGQMRYYSQRSVAVFKIWEEVFGDKKRLVRVLASQAVSPWASEQVLTWKDAYKHADALAVAPYFGHSFGNPKTADEVAKMKVEDLVAALAKEVDGENKGFIQKQQALAKKHGLELVAYEGGQHLAGHGGSENNQSLTDLFIAANRHPKMYDLYQQHLQNWFEAGGGLYMMFSNVSAPSKWGSWGVLETQDQAEDKAHKYRAVVEFIRRQPPAK